MAAPSERKICAVTLFREKGGEVEWVQPVVPDASGNVFLRPPVNALDLTIRVRVQPSRDNPLGKVVVSKESRDVVKHEPFDNYLQFLQANPKLTLKDAARLPLWSLTKDGGVGRHPDGGVFFVPEHNIQATGDPEVLERKVVTKEGMWKVQCDSALPTSLRVSYVTTSLAWSLLYHLVLDGDAMNVLAWADVTNDAEDLVNVDIAFATHQPNMASEVSKLSSKKRKQGEDTNEAVHHSRFGAGAAAAMCLSESPPRKAGADEDTFQIVVPKCTVLMGSETQLPLFEALNIAVAHVYMATKNSTTVHRSVRLTNPINLTFPESDRVMVVVGGHIVGRTHMPRIRSQKEGLIHLYPSTEITYETKGDTVTLKNETLAPVEIDFALKSPVDADTAITMHGLDWTFFSQKAEYSRDREHWVQVKGRLPPGHLVVNLRAMHSDSGCGTHPILRPSRETQCVSSASIRPMALDLDALDDGFAQ